MTEARARRFSTKPRGSGAYRRLPWPRPYNPGANRFRKGVTSHRLAALLTILALLLPATAVAAAPYCAPGTSPEFTFGFAHLKSLLGDTMGEPIECIHANPENGDILQQTSTGLSFYSQEHEHADFYRRLEPLGVDCTGFGLLDRFRHRSAGNSRTGRAGGRTHSWPHSDGHPRTHAHVQRRPHPCARITPRPPCRYSEMRPFPVAASSFS